MTQEKYPFEREDDPCGFIDSLRRKREESLFSDYDCFYEAVVVNVEEG